MARRSYNTTRKQREVVCGVYKLTHSISKKFYIGSSTDIKQRFSIHKSLWKHGKNHAKLQELYDTTQQIYKMDDQANEEQPPKQKRVIGLLCRCWEKTPVIQRSSDPLT